MTTIALPRITLPLERLMDVGVRAKEYRQNPIAPHTDEGRLLLALNKLGAAPFAREAVAQYKAEQQRKARAAVPFFGRDHIGRGHIKWRMCFARQYAGQIPLNVQKLILDIRKEAPNTNFAVDYLGDQPLEFKESGVYYPDGTLDPFLLVRCQKEGDYPDDDATDRNGWHAIAVWDEPDFKY